MKSLLVTAALLFLTGCNTYYVKPGEDQNASIPSLDEDSEDLMTQTKFIPCDQNNCGKDPNINTDGPLGKYADGKEPN